MVRIKQPSADEKVDNLMQAAAEMEAIRFLEDFGVFDRLCESPIERLLLAGLFAEHRVREYDVVFMGSLEPGMKRVQGESIYIYQQAKVGAYRADFLILDCSCPLDVKAPRWMVVECDGHDFHERTKDQARRDKQRDRHFQSKGYKVLRFTGSEIWAEPVACAEEVFSQLSCDDEWRNREQ